MNKMASIASAARRQAGEAPIELQHDALAADGLAAHGAMLREAMECEGLIAAGGPAPLMARPLFLSERRYERLCHDTEMALALIGIAERALRGDRRLRDRMFGHHPQRWLIEAHAHYTPETIGRFDILADGKGIYHFIEYNSGICGGAFLSDRLAALHGAAQPIGALSNAGILRYEPCATRFVRSIRSAASAATGAPRPALALVLPDGPAGAALAADPEVQLLVAQYEREAGPAILAPLSTLRTDGVRILTQQGPADAVMVMDWLATLSGCGQNHPIWGLERLPGSWSCNALGACIYRGGKQMFALLSDPALGLALTPAQRNWVDRHIPWTRMIAQGTTQAGGKTVDLIDHMRTHRRRLLIKPCFGRGGRGVTAGWACSEAQWRAAIEDALPDLAIVQARVDAPLCHYPVHDGQQVTDSAMTADICPFVWKGQEVSGLFSRLSTGPLLNLSTGQAMTAPIFIHG